MEILIKISLLLTQFKEVQEMTKKLRKAIAFVLTLNLCVSLFSLPNIHALAEVKDTSAEVSAVEQEIPQYPKAEVDHTIYAPPLNSKNEGTAKDPALETKTESDGITTTTETTWAGSSAAADGRATAVNGENMTTETIGTAPNGSRIKTGTNKGKEILTTTTGTESTQTVIDKTVMRGTADSFSTDTGWQDGYIGGDGEHLSGDKIDVKLANAYDAITVTVEPKGAAEQGGPNTETVTQYTTQKAMEAWIRANHPEVLADPNAEVIVEPAYKTEWIQQGYGGYWGWVYDEDGNPILLRDSAGNPLIESFYIRTSKTYENSEENDYANSYAPVTEVTHAAAAKERPTTIRTVAIELPKGYVPGEKQEISNGLTTLTKVEVITDTDFQSDTYDQVIGYKVTKTVTDSNGITRSSRSYSKYGTRVETETTVAPAADTKTGVTKTTVTTTTKYMHYARKDVERGAKLDASRNVSLTVGKVARGKDHNKITSGLLQPDSSLLDRDLPDQHLISGKDAWTHELSDPDTRTGAFRYEGYGLRSSAYVWTQENSKDKKYNRATQFKITAANGQALYVYCCDKGTDAHANIPYDMVLLEDSGYLAGEAAIAHIEAIASNGFWGTVGNDAADSPKAGSLEAMRSLLTNAKDSTADNIPASVKDLTEAQIAALDEGLALTATQAALWVYGHHEASMKVGNESGSPSFYADVYDTEGQVWREDPDSSFIAELTTEQQAVVRALYDLLSSDYMLQQHQAAQAAETTPTQTSKIIRAEDVKSAALTVKDRLEDNEDGKAVYNTDLTFTLHLDACDNTNQRSNLIVQVMDVTDPDHPVSLGEKRVAGGDDASKSENAAPAGTDGSESTTCTFRDLKLASGTKLRFVLKGTQVLQPGVYLYQSVTGSYSDSQTFVGLTTTQGTRSVDLQMDLSFHVTDAFMQDYDKIQSQYRIVTAGTKQTDISIDSAAQILTRITTEDRIEKTWESSWQETLRTGHNPGDDNGSEVPGGDDDKSTVPGGGDDKTILPGNDNGSKDRTLPAADGGKHVSAAEIPKTGDASLIPYLLMAFASLALAGMTMRQKKCRDRERHI